MHGHTQLAPALLLPTAAIAARAADRRPAWFVLDDFARLIEHSQPEQDARLWTTTRRAASRCAFRTWQTRRSG